MRTLHVHAVLCVHKRAASCAHACMQPQHAHRRSLIMGTISSTFFSALSPFLNCILRPSTSCTVAPVRAEMSSNVSSPGAGPAAAAPSRCAALPLAAKAGAAGAACCCDAERVGLELPDATALRLDVSGMASRLVVATAAELLAALRLRSALPPALFGGFCWSRGQL